MTETGNTVVVPNPEGSPKPGLASGTVSGHGVRVMQNTVVVFLSRGIGLLMAGTASTLLTHALAPERLGEYSVIYAYLVLFGMLSSFGIGPILTREVAQNREDAGSIMFTAMCLASGFAVATGGAGSCDFSATSSERQTFPAAGDCRGRNFSSRTA